jgi:paraquat-inducible protein B
VTDDATDDVSKDRSAPDREDERRWPQARRVLRRWPGIVWALPLAAALLVLYLGVRWVATRGTTVTVTFASAEGVTPGDTKVLQNGVEVGHVTHVRITPDTKRVELTLSMSSRAEPALNTASRFWLLGATPSVTNLQSVRAALAGLIVELAPGHGGTPTHQFTGLDSAPLVMPDERGTFYNLDTATATVQPGAALLYQGQSIGVVAGSRFVDLGRFRLKLFVRAPFDHFVRQGATFWRGSPLKVQLTGNGIETQIAPPSSVLQGSIQFDLPAAARGNPRAPAETAFPLYDDQTSAQQGPTGPEQRYDIAVSGAAGDLMPGAPVSLLGYKVGEVRSARLVFAPGTRGPYTAVTVALYPAKLDVALAGNADAATWRRATDGAVSRLLGQGYRAALVQPIPLVGGHAIALARGGAGPAALVRGPDNPMIPSDPSGGDVNGLIDKANTLLTRVNRIPLEQIGGNVRALTGNLARLSGSREVSDGLVHLDATLRQVDAITRQVQPQVGPLLTKLNQTATELQATAAAARGTLGGGGANQDQSLPEAIRQLTEAARSIRSLTDYLGRHPEALIRGKAKESR